MKTRKDMSMAAAATERWRRRRRRRRQQQRPSLASRARTISLFALFSLFPLTSATNATATGKPPLLQSFRNATASAFDLASSLSSVFLPQRSFALPGPQGPYLPQKGLPTIAFSGSGELFHVFFSCMGGAAAISYFLSIGGELRRGTLFLNDFFRFFFSSFFFSPQLIFFIPLPYSLPRIFFPPVTPL